MSQDLIISKRLPIVEASPVRNQSCNNIAFVSKKMFKYKKQRERKSGSN